LSFFCTTEETGKKGLAGARDDQDVYKMTGILSSIIRFTLPATATATATANATYFADEQWALSNY